MHAALAVPDDLAAALAAAGGPVLLVDDLVDSGWTMTLAAADAAPRRGARGAPAGARGHQLDPFSARATSLRVRSYT